MQQHIAKKSNIAVGSFFAFNVNAVPQESNASSIFIVIIFQNFAEKYYTFVSQSQKVFPFFVELQAGRDNSIYFDSISCHQINVSFFQIGKSFRPHKMAPHVCPLLYVTTDLHNILGKIATSYCGQYHGAICDQAFKSLIISIY